MNERQIFEDALAIDRSEDLQAFLIKACGGDRQLIAHIGDLIKAQQKLGSFLELPPDQLRQTVVDSSQTGAVGTQIGPYKLLEAIGEGGMGTVYMAEQTEPVKRRVALKLIKTGIRAESLP
jgi:serine/threonine protein kinase